MASATIKAIEKELGTLGKTPAWMCSRLGITWQVYNNWRSRGLPKNRVSAVAALFGWDSGALLDGQIKRIGVLGEIDAPYYNVEASMGNGFVTPEYEEIINQISISKRWVRENLSVSNLSNLALLTAYGDSMKPTFTDGDVVIVDRGVTDASLDAVFVLEREGELYIKRVQRRLDGSIRIISDNKEYESYDLSRKEMQNVRILGRVLCAWIAKRL